MQHDRRKLWHATATAICGLLGAGAVAGKIPCKYDVEVLQVDCGILAPTLIQAGGIAEDGAIAGWYKDCSPPNDRGFLWLPDSTFIPITLPVSPFLYQLTAADVNSSHQVVGTYSAPGNGIAETGFIYEAGRITPLGTLPGGNYSMGIAVSESGFVTGNWGNHSGGRAPGLEAFLWGDSVMYGLGADLGTLLSEGLDVSGQGAVTGWMGKSLTERNAYIWQAGEVTSLPAIPGGFTSIGRAINSRSSVAGFGLFAIPEGGSINRAFAYIDGNMIVIDPFAGYAHSGARGINDHDVIIGTCTGAGLPTKPFVWANGVMMSLNDLIDPDLGITIWNALSVNNIGQISADGDSGHSVFRLTPVRTTAGDLNCDEHVDIIDVQLLLGTWGVCTYPCDADLDGTGIVNGIDLAMLLAAWG